MDAGGNHDGWVLHEAGPPGADQTVLLLPGALCTDAFFEDLISEPRLAASSIRLVSTTLPGFGRTRPPDDLSMEGYAGLAGKLAGDFGCDLVVGHSVGANVALEMAAAGEFSGPLLLLSPTFSRRDESIFPRVLDRLGRVLGDLPFRGMLKIVGPAIGGSLPAHRRDALVADLKNNDPGFVRHQTRHLLEYLDRHRNLVARLCDAGVSACVVFGEHDDTGLLEAERRGLDECPHTRLVTIAGAGHATMVQEPGRIAELLLEMLPASGR